MARRSEQRDLILSVVRSTMEHPTAAWVHETARRALPRLGLGTVYRNLARLAAEGLIREIRGAPGPARFDANVGRHYHIRCLGCGRVNDLPVPVDTRLEEAAARTMDFVVLGHERCGAVRAALEARRASGERPARIAALVDPILPGLEGLDRSAPENAAVEANVRWATRQLAGTAAGGTALAERRVELVGAVCALATGRVRFLR